MKELPKKYNVQEAEKKWQFRWDENKTYKWDQSQPRDNTFVIDTPPPTVSGLLHMGHVFSYTQADFIARYQRMSGKAVFYPMGFDDNGLPTERLVEKVKKVRANDMSREDFIKLCEGVSEEARGDFRALFKSTAMSVDWDEEYHTISAQSRKISQLSFLDLFHKERAYRKLQPMLWDPIDQTAIAQAEVEDKEMDSHANYIPFGIISAEEGENPESINWDSIEKVEIMTTRPELLAACVALMVHPDDAAKFAGKKAVTPLFNIVVDIVADAKVDKDKGTGFVMCCTFGDETDIEWWRTHDLKTRVILDKYGKLRVKEILSDCHAEGSTNNPSPTTNNPAPTTCHPAPKTCHPALVAGSAAEAELAENRPRNKCGVTADGDKVTAELIDSLEGLKVKAARVKMIETLDAAGLLLKQEPINHAVKCAERSGAALEFIPTTQWFVKILDQKEQLKAKAEECNWYPEYMKIRIDQWIDGLSWDWCISRQRYFGVPFPVWYSKRAGEESKIIIAKPDQLPCNPLVDLPKGYTRDEVEAEADVMDTWATSSVSPQLSSKAITKEYALNSERHSKLFPADLRPQAHEIIRTWAFYTIVKAHLHEDKIPWKNLMISGWCLAKDKTKMSKSKGNVVTPVALIEEKGADAVRYWASTSNLGTDTAFSEDVLKIGKKLVNKIWNASKFAAIQLDNLEGQPSNAADDIASGIIYEPIDKWILSRLGKTISKATSDFEKFEYCKARSAIEDFFWNDFCDNYLEMVKARAYDEQGQNLQAQQSACYSIHHILDTILKLFAPFVPHITEELYSHIFDAEFEKIGSLHKAGSWPNANEFPVDEESELAGKTSVAILNVVRKLKTDKNVSIKYPIENLYIEGEKSAILEACFTDLAKVTNSANINWLVESSKEAVTAQTEDKNFNISVIFAKESDAA